ncbi:hypothetical protein AB0P40_27465, partial [Streptomyces sp. NPDC079189]
MPGTEPMPSTTTAWEELVTSALLGTDRRPLAAGAGRGPITLLDAAALHTVRRRARALAIRPKPSSPSVSSPDESGHTGGRQSRRKGE